MEYGGVEIPIVQTLLSAEIDRDLKHQMRRLGIVSKPEIVLLAVEEFLKNHSDELDKFREKYQVVLDEEEKKRQERNPFK